MKTLHGLIALPMLVAAGTTSALEVNANAQLDLSFATNVDPCTAVVVNEPGASIALPQSPGITVARLEVENCGTYTVAASSSNVPGTGFVLSDGAVNVPYRLSLREATTPAGPVIVNSNSTLTSVSQTGDKDFLVRFFTESSEPTVPHGDLTDTVTFTINGLLA